MSQTSHPTRPYVWISHAGGKAIQGRFLLTHSTGLLVAVTATITVLAGMAILPSSHGSSNRLDGNSNLVSSGPLVAPGTYVTFACFHGSVSLGSTEECDDNNVGPYDECPSGQCEYALTGTIDSSHSFKDWIVTGAATVGSTSQLSTTVTFTAPKSGTNSANLIECTQGAPQITGNQFIPYNVYEQGWVNWSDSNEYTSQFLWGLTTSYNLPVPSLNGLSVNLNILNASTTYYYKIIDTNSCEQSTSVTGSFTTGSAPNGKFVGWVSAQSLLPNQYLLNDISHPLSGAQVAISASCPTSAEYPGTWPTLMLWSEANGSYSPVLTSSTGAYTLTFPLYTNVWTGGGVSVVYWLDGNGNCDVYWWFDNNPTDNGLAMIGPESEYEFEVWDPGYFNSSRIVSATYSGENDYQAFLEMTNLVEPQPTELALIHTPAGDPQASCSFTYWTSSGTSTVSSYDGLNGYQAENYTSTSASGWNSPGSWGGDNALNLETPISGSMLYGQPVTAENPTAWVVGQAQSVGAVPINTTEWITNLNTNTYPPNGVLPSGWHGAQPNAGQGEGNALQKIIYHEGSYSSTSGYITSFDVGFDIAGIDVSTPFTWSSTVTVTTSITATATCSFAYLSDPSGHGGYPYFYYFDGAPGDLTMEIPIVHVWFEGWCQEGNPNYGEPSC